MTPLLVATRSRGKQSEFRALFEGSGRAVVFPVDLGIAETPEELALESHASFEGNARAKAQWFAEHAGIDALADDSGLEVDALGGLPGVHSRRFSGHDGPDHLVTGANNAALLAQLDGVPDDRRTARYRCVLVLSPGPLASQRTEVVAEGVVEGRILTAPRGDGGFGYDPLFFSDELGVTFGEATAAAKHAVSHRGRALRSLLRQMARRDGKGGMSV